MDSEATASNTPDLYAQYNDETSGRTAKQLHQRAIRPKLLKLTTDNDTVEFGLNSSVRTTEGGILTSGTNTTSSTGSRGRNKNKTKSKDSSRERYADDPAYTEDVRHLAFPQRRNSGPESARRKSCSILQGRFMDIGSIGGGNQTDDVRLAEQKTKNRTPQYSDDKTGVSSAPLADTKDDPKYRKHRGGKEYQHSSSSDESDYDRRGQSLDRSSTKQSKKTLCFKRDREPKASEFRKEGRYLPRKDSNTDSFGSNVQSNFDTYASGSGSRSSRSRNRHPDNPDAHKYRRPTDLPMELDEFVQAPYIPETKSTGRFQIGKRLLKGEIGIKSFNYYLLKEGLKSTKKSTNLTKSTGAVNKALGLSKSEENIYEEIYFVDRRPGRKASSTLNQYQQPLPPPPSQATPLLYPDCELCNLECTNKNCDICKATEGHGGRGATTRLIGNAYVGPTSKLHGGGGRAGGALNRNQSTGNPAATYATTTISSAAASGTVGDSENQSAAAAEHSRQQHVLQYQSYNPNNPGVFKIETTPVAFTSDYNPIHHSIPTEQQQQQQQQQQHHQSGPHHYSRHPDTTASHQFAPQPHTSKSHKQPHPPQSHHQPYMLSTQHPQSHAHYDTNNRTKSSSSSDSLHHQKYAKQTINRHQNNNNNLGDYPTPDEYHAHHHQPPLPHPPVMPSISGVQQQHRNHAPSEVQSKYNPSYFPTSILTHHHTSSSEHHHQQQQPGQDTHQFDLMNAAKIYKTDSRTSIMSENMSVKSENSGGYRGGGGPYHPRSGADMSDSSIGDSLFSYSAQRRYFGSAESCRFGYECRRCSYDGDKCSFSDNCRYECRNCDCSSSYFSSDFDEANQFSRQNSARMSASIPPAHIGGSSTSSSGVRDHQYPHTNPHQRHNTSPATGSDSMDMKPTRYAEDFIKHITNVKQSAIYQLEESHAMSTGITKPLPTSYMPFHDTSAHPSKTNDPPTSSASVASVNLCPDYATVANKKPTPTLVAEPRTDTNKSDGFTKRMPTDDCPADTKTKSLPAPKKSSTSTAADTTPKTTSNNSVSTPKTSAVTTGAIPKTARSTSNPNPTHLSTPQRQRSSGARASGSPKKSTSLHHANQTSDQQPPRPATISAAKSKSSPILHKHSHPGPSSQANSNINNNNNNNAAPALGTQPKSTSQFGDAPRPTVVASSLIQPITDERTITKTPFNARKALPALPVVYPAPPSSPSLPCSASPSRPTAMPRTMFEKYAPKGVETITTTAATPTAAAVPTAADEIGNNTKMNIVSIENNQRVASSSPRRQPPAAAATATTAVVTPSVLTRYADDGGVSVDDDDGAGVVGRNDDADEDADGDDSDDVHYDEDDVKDGAGTGEARPRRRRKIKRHATGIASSRHASGSNLVHAHAQQQQPHQLQHSVPKPQPQPPSKRGEGQQSSCGAGAVADSPNVRTQRPRTEHAGSQAKKPADDGETRAEPHDSAGEIAEVVPLKASDTIATIAQQAPNSTKPENQNNNQPRSQELVATSSSSSDIKSTENHPISTTITSTCTTPASTTIGRSGDTSNNGQVREQPTCDGDPSASSVGFASSTTTSIAGATIATTTTTTKSTDHHHRNDGSSSSSPVTQSTLRQQSQPLAAFSVATEVAGDASSHSDSNGNLPRHLPFHPIASSTPDLLSIAITQDLVQKLGDFHQGPLQHPHYESNDSLPTSTTATITSTSAAFDSSDILDLPLPAIPVKRRDRKSNNNDRNHPLALSAPKEYSSLPTSYKSHRRSLSHQPVFTGPSQHPLNNGAQLRAQRAGIFVDIAKYRSAAASYLSESRELVSADETMHYHSSHEKPKYLFGERSQHHNNPHLAGDGASHRNDQIYLNKSGWVQVNQRSFEKSPNRNNDQRRLEYTKGLSQFGDDAQRRVFRYDDVQSFQSKNPPRATNNMLRSELNRPAYSRNSKIEELLNRSEARRSSVPHKLNYNIDPQISAILNERPGFLPVKRLTDNESPPPITPIISPPPAFQDSKAKPIAMPAYLTVNNNDPRRQPPKIPSLQPPPYSPLSPPIPQTNQAQHIPGKGMVFSRSFEYDNRKNRDYKDNFSKSFDYDLTNNPPTQAALSIQPDKLRTKMFTNLTGVSPNYLTKKETSARGSRSSSREPSPVYQTPTEAKNFVEPFRTKSRVRNTLSVRPDKFMSLDEQQGRSRRAQFSRLHHESSSSSGSQGFRSLDQSVTNTVNRRLNSCDSGARSDLSNDEIDDDPRTNKKRSKFLKTQSHHDMITKQRSLTPDKSADEQQPLLRRSLTPEKFGTNKNSSDGSQTSLFIKHQSSGSGSRSSTLERPQSDEKLLVSSRSSSSSYSGGEHETPGFRRVSQRHVSRSAENRIRRSRSLQLSERSPNRTTMTPHQQHKLVVRLGGNPQQSPNELFRPVRSPSMQHNTRYPPSQTHPSDQLSHQSKDFRNHDNDKSKSFDLDYNHQPQYPYNFKADFDKSRSFDDDYGNSNRLNVKPVADSRSFSNERVYQKGTGPNGGKSSSSSSSQKQQSPQSYGSRLYEHEMMYDLARKSMDRSPIMEFRRQKRNPNNRSRERSPNSNVHEAQANPYRPLNRSTDQRRELSPSSGSAFAQQHQGSASQFLSASNSHSSPGSEFEHHELSKDQRREADMVTDFLYGHKSSRADASGANVVHPPRRKESSAKNAAANPATSGTSQSPGSCCTARSCDYWPNCGNCLSVAHRSNSARRVMPFKSEHSVLRSMERCSQDDEVQSTVVEEDDQHLYDEVNSESLSDVDIRPDRISESVPNLSEYNIDIEAPYGISSGHSAFRGIPPSIGPSVVRQQQQQQQRPNRRRVSPSPEDRIKALPNRGVTSRKPPMYERSRSSSVLFLGEREMPITRDRQSRSPKRSKAISFDEPSRIVPTDTGARMDARKTRRNQNLRLPTNSALPVRWTSNDPAKVRSPVFQAPVVSPIRRHHQRERFRSRSLPNTFSRTGSTKSSVPAFVAVTSSQAGGVEVSVIESQSSVHPHSANLSLQMRAVSSPSLSENLHDPLSHRADATLQRTDIDIEQMANICPAPVAAAHATESTNANDQSHNGSVLQKLRNTFSHLKNKSSSGIAVAQPTSVPAQNNNQALATCQTVKDAVPTVSNTPANQTVPSTGNGLLNVSSDYSTTYRFGPLVWRTSKERRKTKYHRRDKCNSGDSGIQVELDNEDIIPGPESLEASNATTTASATINVRRANSAKVQSSSNAAVSSSTRAKLIRKNSECSSMPRRSLSQPSGLNRLAKETEPLKKDSDSESEDFTIHRPPLPPPADHPVFAEVLYTFAPASDQELALEKGALVEVIKRDPGPWWWGRTKYDAVIPMKSTADAAPLEGWFPKDFVRLIVPLFPSNRGTTDTLSPAQVSPQQRPLHPPYVEARNCDISYPLKAHHSPVSFKRAASQSPSNVSPRTSTGAFNEAIRSSVIRELLETEVNYVKLLTAICTGFIEEMRQRPDVFSEESIILIFSNIEQIWQFQQAFLDALRLGIATDRVAETFLEYQSGFMVYSVYCNTYSRALMELETYNSKPEAAAILESCRLTQCLPELPLSAHLLAPIQRICRYPLHLSELVKHTTGESSQKRPSKIVQRQEAVLDDPNEQLVDDEVDVIDGVDENADDGFRPEGDSKNALEVALAAMKHVTEMVNEGKRHSEYLSRIQARFDNFQGPSISVHSTRLFLQTDAIRMTPNLWNNTYTLFLFDSQLIYCKKDLLKRTTYTYKGRIFLDNCRILNLPDGKIFGLTLKNALRIYCDTRSKWFDFCFRSGSSKLRFLNTLSAERKFSGHSLFVSELAGVDEDDLSDRETSNCTGDQLEMAMSMTTEDGGTVRLIERAVDVENLNPQDERKDSVESQTSGKYKKSDTLPKKSRKLLKEPTVTSYEYHSSSLGRKRIGNWFRKAKSTNTTPSQSPTHHPGAGVSASSVDEAHMSSPLRPPSTTGQHSLANEAPRPMDSVQTAVTSDPMSP